jgi:anti-sigma28 factor (negative regulator of flagellin synthesis)
MGQENDTERARLDTAPTAGPLTRNIEDDATRALRVAVLKKAVADGLYYVRSSDVADKLIEHMLQR